MWIFYCMRYWPNGFIFAIGPSGLICIGTTANQNTGFASSWPLAEVAIIFSRFFETSKKGPKGAGLFAPDNLENNNSKRKGKEEKKERGGREEETKKKQ